MATLVTYASKHGATAGIADRIAELLRQRGQEATVRPVSAATDLQPYEAFVIGSAVYMGSWMQEATEFVQRNRALLTERSVWLFSSGPTGDATLPEPKQIAEFQATIPLRDHRVFAGALDRQQLSFSERVIVEAVKAATGDFRDWDDIEAWAENIAHALALPARAAQPG